MTVALILLAVVQPVTVFFVLRYVKARDELERTERAELLQRIQAPEQAVVQHAIKEAPPSLPAVLPDDDEDYWKASEQALLDFDRELKTHGR